VILPNAGELAPAKINLSLRIVGRRPDGYHLLDSIVVFAEVGDWLRAEPADALSLEIIGHQAGLLQNEPDNLVLRAARALQNASGEAAGARIVLEKYLPVASGIGGGSADAAAALRLLARLWRVPAAIDLKALSATLGADVPVCLHGRAARMRGIGEHLDAVPPLPPCGLVLVNPGVAVSTSAVFQARAPGFRDEASPPREWGDLFIEWLRNQPNDLEPPALELCPAIGTVLTALRAQPDCLLARMSGSGATCFGLFPHATLAQQCAADLARSGWWCWGGNLCSNSP
jgi:4-diphosphocytidyl-2-C-methyl-D-erythritol kinase